MDESTVWTRQINLNLELCSLYHTYLDTFSISVVGDALASEDVHRRLLFLFGEHSQMLQNGTYVI
jgi:hypothetical protein